MKLNAEAALQHIRAGGKVKDKDGDIWAPVGTNPGWVNVQPDETLVNLEMHLYGPFVPLDFQTMAAEPEPEPNTTRDVGKAIGWEQWVCADGHRHRRNPGDGSAGFQFMARGNWRDCAGPGRRPWSRVKVKTKTKPAPATLAECIKAEPQGRWRCDGGLRMYCASTHLSAAAEDLEKTTWECAVATQGMLTWYSPNGTVDE